MPRHRVRACGNKVRFRDHEEAIEALHRAVTVRRRCEVDGVATSHLAVRDYYCSGCGGFHLTSQERRQLI